MIYKYLLLSTLVFLLFSCEGGTDLIKQIDNNSEEQISIIVFNNYYQRSDTIHMSPNSSHEYYSGGSIGQFFTDYMCLDEVDSIQVIIHNQKVLTKDIEDLNNWTLSSNGKRNVTHRCNFFINASDIQ